MSWEGIGDEGFSMKKPRLEDGLWWSITKPNTGRKRTANRDGAGNKIKFVHFVSRGVEGF